MSAQEKWKQQYRLFKECIGKGWIAEGFEHLELGCGLYRREAALERRIAAQQRTIQAQQVHINSLLDTINAMSERL